MQTLITKYRQILGLLMAIGLLSLTSVQDANAQLSGPQDIRWIRVGSIHSWFSSGGAEIEYGRRGRGCCESSDQLDVLDWPALFANQNRGAAKGFWIGTTNFDDPVSGNVYAHKVIAAGTRTAYTLTELMPFEFSMQGKSFSPSVFVDGIPATDNTLNDEVDEIAEGLEGDRVVINKLHTSIGLTITRKIIGSSQQYHDNYYIYEYVFKNTGIIDLDGNTVEKTLTDVMIGWQYRYGFHEQLSDIAGLTGTNYGLNTVNQTIGSDPTASDFEFRAQYSWYGPHSSAPSYDADWGNPDYINGRYMDAVQYVGTVILHADKSATDKSDDPYQPMTTITHRSDRDASSPDALGQYNEGLMTTRYELLTAGHPEQTHADALGNAFADLNAGDNGGRSQSQGFGPYTLAPGDSIRIVIAEGVAGISRAKNIEVTQNWFNETGNYVLPGGGTTSDRNQYKREWVQTGEDSILQTFRRAIARFQNDYNIPEPPPAPEQFNVTSGGDRIILEWADNATSATGFDGYKIFRAIGRPDTLYEEIFSCDVSNVVHRYDDTSAIRGTDYYYYVVSKDNGATNSVSPGVPLYSSKFATITNQPAFLRRPAGTALDQIRVVPNPFHIGARSIQFPGQDARDRIAFYGLPPVCTIKIYTERGDLIETIEHNDGTGDELWHSLTSARQVIVSGLYIALIETPEGESAYQKFIIIR